MRHKLAGLLLFLALPLFAFTGTALAADLFPPGTTGYDLSFPECDIARPPLPFSFAIVGATGGKAFNHNPCLSSEYTWALLSGRQPALYMNLKSPVGTSADQALTGPRGTCQPNDQACLAYNFGYKAAQDALAYATSQRVTASSWWLDIETMSSWSTDTSMNAIVIGAAIDYLKAQGATVGIYSTPSQWAEIAGNYTPGLPVWVTTAPSAALAPTFCPRGFAGGQVQLVQYIVGQYDGNYACTAADRTAVIPSPVLGPPGSLATIASDGDCLNLRAQPGLTGAPRTCLAAGSQVTVLDGSSVSDGFRWQLVSASGTTGWVASNYLHAGAVTPPPPAQGTFAAAPVFGPSGQALVVYNGGTIDQLEAAASTIGATGIWAQDPGGTYRLLIVRGPAFANAAFRSAFPTGFASAVGVSLRR